MKAGVSGLLLAAALSVMIVTGCRQQCFRSKDLPVRAEIGDLFWPPQVVITNQASMLDILALFPGIMEQHAIPPPAKGSTLHQRRYVMVLTYPDGSTRKISFSPTHWCCCGRMPRPAAERLKYFIRASITDTDISKRLKDNVHDSNKPSEAIQ